MQQFFYCRLKTGLPSKDKAEEGNEINTGTNILGSTDTWWLSLTHTVSENRTDQLKVSGTDPLIVQCCISDLDFKGQKQQYSSTQTLVHRQTLEQTCVCETAAQSAQVELDTNESFILY